jgi:beta-aspartyl-peptidase (threonine type)
MFGLAIHGGAGTLPRAEMSAESEARYRAGLSEALAAGFAVLEHGGTSLDAVTRAVVALEDLPLFNAGRGAVFTHEGQNELDASIMEGATRKAGAVCGLAHVKNPIELARAVMEHSEYVMLAGTGAEEFALTRGVALVPRSYFYTEARWRQLERLRAGETGLSPLTISHVGTVGAVAADAAGRLAAATSTGGMTGKRFGRIGDSPIIGAGTYADDRACAVSATGHGEIFIRLAVAHEICARVRLGHSTLAEAVREVVLEELPAQGGEGGVIAIDRDRRIVMEFNSEGMFRASRVAGGAPVVEIYRSASAAGAAAAGAATAGDHSSR